MNLGRGRWSGTLAVAVAGLIAGGAGVGARQGSVPPPMPVPYQAGAPEDGQTPGAEVLTRGPIHEAFAEPVVFDPRPGPVIPKEPPAPIEEVPPDQKPQGAEVAWIPGYWGWDDERQDFVWVSGLWRQPPPGRQWVPGYWLPAEGGYRWIPGSWSAGDPGAAAQYLPTPPDSLEQGPSSPQPAGDYTWGPGNWLWSGERYAWQPGYWVPAQPDWAWVPPYYTYSPYGCLYHTGYWDYTLASRGQLFAPVYFAQPVYARPNFVYTPSVGLLGGALMASLFVRPQYHQYYFGDYYGANYSRSGIYPWYSVHQGRSGYDPLYAQMAAMERRRNPGWSNQLQEEYRFRRDHPEARPARTFLAQRAQAIQRGAGGRDLALAQPLSQLAGGPGARFERLDAGRREALRAQSAQVQRFRAERLRREGEGARALPVGNSGGLGGPRRLDLPRSPVASAMPGGATRIQAARLRETQLEVQNAQAARHQAVQAARQQQQQARQEVSQDARRQQAQAVRQQQEAAAARQQQAHAARQQKEAEAAQQQARKVEAARQQQQQQQAQAARQQQQAAQAARQQRESEAARQRQEQMVRQQQAAQAARQQQQQVQAARQQQAQAAQAARRAQLEAAQQQRKAGAPKGRAGG